MDRSNQQRHTEFNKERGFDPIYAEIRSFSDQRSAGRSSNSSLIRSQSRNLDGNRERCHVRGQTHDGGRRCCLPPRLRTKGLKVRPGRGRKSLHPRYQGQSYAGQARQAGGGEGHGKGRSRWRHHRSQFSRGCQVESVVWIEPGGNPSPGFRQTFLFREPIFIFPLQFAMLDLTTHLTLGGTTNWAKIWSPKRFSSPRGSASIASV